MSREISETIAELACAGKVNAISAMTVSDRWERDAGFLQGLPTTVEIGLHIVLTDEKPLTAMRRLVTHAHLPNASTLQRRALLNLLPLKEIAAEIEAQFGQFETVLGRPPMFVDGHQHVHVLPLIRDLVLAATARRAPCAWLRNCGDHVGRILSRPFRVKAIVNAFQSSGFAHRAARAGLRCNDSFSGLYDFHTSYEKVFPRFLRSPGDFHLVICHPGGEPRSFFDPIAAARVREANALRSLDVGALALANGLAFPQ